MSRRWPLLVLCTWLHACGAPSSVEDLAATGAVDASAGADAGPDGAAQCVAPGGSCSLRPCCDGDCDPIGGRCVHGPGGTCDVTVDNPSALCAIGTACELASGTCVALSCITPSYEAICDVLKGIPCCTAATVCTGIPLELPGGGTLYRCCAANGTLLSSAQSALCCSHATLHIDDSTVKCIEDSPPH